MIASNITQKKLLERQLFQNEKMIFLGKIISEIIHDIKNPLASITSAITGLQNSQTPGNAQTDKEINDINQAASLIHGVILKTLGLVKVVPAGHNVIDLNAVVARSADWCKNNAKIKNREIIFEKPPEKALISGNEPQLEQVFINLISNALNAVEEKKDGKVKIEIETCGSLISCSIEDNGRGMDEETLNNIFDPSFNTARSGNSSGIGLCICQAILSQHNASINCRSKLNEGSIFTVDFSRAGRNKL